MKLGSLFDGSGGFPFAASICGIEPKWAAEVEPYPVAVTKSRFPHMKHLGDVGKINGAEIEPVDIITAGSPCQDLSVAGKRAGLKHESNGDEVTTRSGLFMEFIRIIKEMREATNGEYPRFALWENVPGAFSSNKGEDFRIVLEEFIKVNEPAAVMPEVPKNGWPYADSYCGDGWSIAYRVFDAQYWGVPQRRRRIHLVADFRGECARKVLFERDGLRGNFAESGAQREAVAADAERSIGADDREGAGCELNAAGFDGYNVAATGSVAKTVTAGRNDTHNIPSVCYGISSYDSNAMRSSNPHSGVYEATTSRTLDLNGGNPACNQGGIAVVQPTMEYENKPRYIVRRLTPTECARLQGFPDNWGHPDRKNSFTDEEYAFWLDVRNTHAAINSKAVKEYTKEQMLSWYNKLHTDSAEYKMWGNGIALPPTLYCMQGIAETLKGGLT